MIKLNLQLKQKKIEAYFKEDIFDIYKAYRLQLENFCEKITLSQKLRFSIFELNKNF